MERHYPNEHHGNLLIMDMETEDIIESKHKFRQFGSQACLCTYAHSGDV